MKYPDLEGWRCYVCDTCGNVSVRDPATPDHGYQGSCAGWVPVNRPPVIESHRTEDIQRVWCGGRVRPVDLATPITARANTIAERVLPRAQAWRQERERHRQHMDAGQRGHRLRATLKLQRKG